MHHRGPDRAATHFTGPPRRHVGPHAIRGQLDNWRIRPEPLEQVLGASLTPSPIEFSFQRAVARVTILREVARNEDAQREGLRIVPFPGIPEPYDLDRIARRALPIVVPQADLPVLAALRIPNGHVQHAAGCAFIDPDAVPTSGAHGSRPAFTGGHMALLASSAEAAGEFAYVRGGRMRVAGLDRKVTPPVAANAFRLRPP